MELKNEGVGKYNLIEKINELMTELQNDVSVFVLKKSVYCLIKLPDYFEYRQYRLNADLTFDTYSISTISTNNPKNVANTFKSLLIGLGATQVYRKLEMPKFTCPRCQAHLIEVIYEGTMSAIITDVEDEMINIQNLQMEEDVYIERFQCDKCGHIIDLSENSPEDLAEYLNK